MSPAHMGAGPAHTGAGPAHTASGLIWEAHPPHHLPEHLASQGSDPCALWHVSEEAVGMSRVGTGEARCLASSVQQWDGGWTGLEGPFLCIVL